MGGLIGANGGDGQESQNLPPVGGQEFEHTGQDTLKTSRKQRGKVTQ